MGVLQAIASEPDGQAAIGAADAASSLVRLAASKSTAVQLAATALLCDLARHESNLAPLLAAGAMVPIVSQLRDGTAAAQTAAAAAVDALSGARASLRSSRLSVQFGARPSSRVGEGTPLGGAQAAVAAGAVPPLVRTLMEVRARRLLPMEYVPLPTACSRLPTSVSRLA